MESLNATHAHDFANEWVGAWNSHDLEQIMSHYADDVTLVSPTAAMLLGDSSGEVRGKDALRAYFHKGLEVYPNLNFEIFDVMWGVNSVVVCYFNQKGTKSAELMELDGQGQVTRVVANYGA